jgi:GABA permease
MVLSASEKGGAMVAELTARPRRILYVAREACGNPALCAEVRAHADAGAEVLVVAPVVSSWSHRWTSDDAEDRERAEARLEESIACLRGNGLRVQGTLGDADEVQAIADALFAFPAEEIVICLEEPERSHWARKGVVERARERFGVPVTEIDVAERAPAVLV